MRLLLSGTNHGQFLHAGQKAGQAVIMKAGYRPDQLAAVQDGNFFFTVTKDGVIYQATVTGAGKLFVSTGLPTTDLSKPAAG